MAEKIFLACDDNLNTAMAFIEEELEKAECPMKTVMQITVCFEEMYVNVSHYAYEGMETGNIGIKTDFSDGVFSITLTDSGVPFDPLAKEDPDITLAAEQRKIGGLGIYMVKKTMDSVSYRRTPAGENVFTMSKKI